MYKTDIGFIGAGNMATAIIKGISSSRAVPGPKIAVINKSNRRHLAYLCDTYKVRAADSYEELVMFSESVILAVKPNQMFEVLENISDFVTKEHLIISVAAGITTKSIETFFRPGVAVIRAMPNTPAQVGEGVSVLCSNEHVTEEQKARAESVFASVGKVFWLDETYMDAVTALSGGGPAYFYRLAQEMAKVAEEMGLGMPLSEELSRQTLIGAGCLLKSTESTLDELVCQIASPKGTTEAALRVLESKRMNLLIEEAIGEALRRSEEISETYSHKETKKRSAVAKAKRVVVKIGSSTVTDNTGIFNEDLLRGIATQIFSMMSQGRQVVIVSSGAIAAGKGRVGKENNLSITEKQVLASVGQGILMKSYETLFEEFDITVGQVLLTKDDLASAKRSSLCKNTLEEMLSRSIVPIINENDTVAVEEIRFGDNDSLSASVAVLIGADLLVLLTDTEGFYDKNPQTNSDARLITSVAVIDESVLELAKGTHNDQVGTGGMITKVWAANTAMEHGIPTVIANGSTPDVLSSIMAGEIIGTLFHHDKDFSGSKLGQGGAK